ncbi:MAG: M28 family peptidase [Deltaproteobacteria bacterium]
MRISLTVILLLIALPIHSLSGERCADYRETDITPREILSHIKYLASDELEGRMTGAIGGDRAAHYIAGCFKESGLLPFGDDGTYFQGFPLSGGVEPGKLNSLALTISGDKKKLEPGKDYFPLGFSANGEAAGGIIFAGYGITAPELDYDDYRGIDVEGKIVLVLRFTPDGLDIESPFYDYADLRYKVSNAEEKGAAAVIFTTPDSEDSEDELSSSLFRTPAPRAGIQAVIVRSGIAEEILSAAGKELGELEETLSGKKGGPFAIRGAEAEISTELIEEKRASANVLGFIPGNDPALKDEVIVVGAHYDHLGRGIWEYKDPERAAEGEIFNGADDNASGVAGLLELSEYFSDADNSMKRSLLFIAFSGEELGLLGSTYYIDHPAVSHENTVAMINMDMMGRLNENKLIVFGVSSSPEWQSLIAQAGSGLNLELTLEDSVFAPSDQLPFYEHEIPAVQFFTGLHDEYHTPGDDWQLINSEGEKRVLALISNLIMELGDRKDKITFSGLKIPGVAASGFSVYLGTIPDYAGAGKGVSIRGVRAGSPAAGAGLEAGDRIVGLAGIEVESIYDFGRALESLTPGVPAEIVIIREGKRIKLNAVPEKR